MPTNWLWAIMFMSICENTKEREGMSVMSYRKGNQTGSSLSDD
jgi:hypothetical protein